MAKNNNPQNEPTTTIQLPTELKSELEEMKVDEKDTYAGVIKRLIQGKEKVETPEDTVNISLPKKVYLLLQMALPDNIGEQVRKGVR